MAPSFPADLLNPPTAHERAISNPDACFALLQLSLGRLFSELMVHATRGTEETDVSLLQ
jgi:hypothetical protein